VPSRRRHVDPIRVHLITLVVFGVIAGAALALWMFPRFFAAIALLAVSVLVYSRIYAFIEQRLEAEEGRLAEELGFELEDDADDEVDLAPKKKRKKKRAVDAGGVNGAPVTAAAAESPAAPPVPPADPA
jgi:hypothetical protein